MGLAVAALLATVLAAPSAGLLPLPAPSEAETCDGIEEYVVVCLRDDDGDGTYDGGSYFAGAVVLVLIVGAGGYTEGELSDGNGDGAPETADVTPVYWIVGILWADPGCILGNPTDPSACIYFLCILCDGVSVRLDDPDGDGVPNHVSAHLGYAGDVEHTV